MPFQKGHKPPANAGRKPGSLNKINIDTRQRINLLLQDKFDEFNLRMNSLSNAEYCDLYVKLLPFVIAKTSFLHATVSGGGGFGLILPDNLREDEFTPSEEV